MRKDKLTAFALIFIAAAPLVVATAMYFGGYKPAGATNEGVLLDPIWQDATLEWRYSENDPRLEDGRLSTWQVLVIDGAQRDELLYLSRQVVTALGRESERMGRSFISSQALSAADRNKIALEHAGLAFAVTPTAPLLAELVTRGADPAIQSAGAIVLADPLGNLVLVYHQHTGKQLIKDFKRLLKASKIG